MKHIRLIFSALIIFSAFSSCQKTYESLIVGEWKHGNVAPQFDNTVWKFYDDGSVEILNDPNGYEDTVVATYHIDGQLHIPYVIIEDAGPNLNGMYQADELNTEFLKMTRRELEDGSEEAAYLRREFKKK